MDISEKRVMGSLFLLLGLSFLTMGLHIDQLDIVAEMMKKVFEAALAGL